MLWAVDRRDPRCRSRSPPLEVERSKRSSKPSEVERSKRPIFYGSSEPSPAVERSVKPITVFSSRPLEPPFPPPALGRSSPASTASNIGPLSILIQEQSAQEAVRRFVDLVELHAVRKLVLFDFHGVLDLSQTQSCRVITDLVAKGIPVGTLRIHGVKLPSQTL